MKSDTNYFYAIFYSLWRFETKMGLKVGSFFRKVLMIILPKKWYTDAMKKPEIANKAITVKRNIGISVYYAKRTMLGMIIFILTLFVGPIAGFLENKGYHKWPLISLMLLCFLFTLYLDETVFEESKYRKYLIKYDKRDSSWKRKWGILSIVYIIFSFGCLIISSVIFDHLKS